MERWTNDVERLDGTTIQKLADTRWVVRAADGHTILACPCCGGAIETSRAARFVADAVFPLVKERQEAV